MFLVKCGLQLHEQTTLRSITMFTVSHRIRYLAKCKLFFSYSQSNYIEYTKTNHRAAELLQQNGFEIIQILLEVRLDCLCCQIKKPLFQCIGGASPRHLVDTLSLPLYSLSKLYTDWTSNWVQQCLNDPNFPTPSPKRHHREALIKALTS